MRTILNIVMWLTIADVVVFGSLYFLCAYYDWKATR